MHGSKKEGNLGSYIHRKYLYSNKIVESGLALQWPVYDNSEGFLVNAKNEQNNIAMYLSLEPIDLALISILIVISSSIFLLGDWI